MSVDQEQGLRILDNALWRIARQHDCDYALDEAERPTPCVCAPCVARAALRAARDWRFYGALWERTQSGQWPREAKMRAAWMKIMNDRGADRLLSQVLQEEESPSARDWYVATLVIQWLAAHVGMTVLEAAGFAYQQWDQDRADGELFRRRQEQDQNEAERIRRRQGEKKSVVEESEKAAAAQQTSPVLGRPSDPSQEPCDVALPKPLVEGATAADSETALSSTFAEWTALVEQLNKLRKRLDEKPKKWRASYSLHPGSLLNAYREVDLSFNEVCDLLRLGDFFEACAAYRTSKVSV